MKQRKKRGAIISIEFNKFRNFLMHLGPGEDKNYTLDRINNDDPEYAPGKVKWRDKYAQNNNKGNGANPNSEYWCPLHNVELKRWEKNGKSWYSHLIDGEWCYGKEGGNHD